MTIEPGTWVTAYYMKYTTPQAWTKVEVAHPGAFRVVGPGHSGTTIVERWRVHPNTRQAKAFGRPIDKTPYRETLRFHATRVVPVHSREAAIATALEERVMRYPTKAERDAARQKRRVARRAAK